jgi:hypothetical protein
VPGVIDRTKLLTMGMRLGIGNSDALREEERRDVFKLFKPSGYDPNKLINPLSKQADELGIEGHPPVHVQQRRRPPPSGSASSSPSSADHASTTGRLATSWVPPLHDELRR